jgi:uncharacterized protein (TIGR00106 family)
MSVLMEFAMFPTDKGGSVSEYVSKVIDIIRRDVPSYKLTAMGTIIEVDTFGEALEILRKAYEVLDPVSERIYSTVKFDIRKGKENRMDGKIRSVENKIGGVKK